MSVVSLNFLLFLLAALLVYYIVPKRFQWIVLLLGSYVFYLFAGVKPLLFVMATTLVIFCSGRYMESVKEKSESKKLAKKKNKKVLVGTIVLIFGVLVVLKYYDFFADNINSMFSTFEWSAKLPLVNIILPLGISFYMFQAIGYCIDVYRGKVTAEKNILKFALFISFFPQATQGPISRFDQLSPQLLSEHSFDYTEFTRGAQLMLWGFFKKLVIADRLGIVVNEVFGNYAECNGIQTFIGIICYALQIYTDFSGGIDIIRGAAECFGIDLIENFKRPYLADTVAEYWRRWHMSLTNWMRDYVFYSMALSKFSNKIGKWGRKHLKGNTGKQLPSYLPTFVTFFLIGIWHGAGWGFILFGLYNATLIVLSMILEPVFKKMNEVLHINTANLGFRIWQIFRTFMIMAIGKCMTRAEDVGAGFAMIGKSFQLNDFSDFGQRMLDLGLTSNNWIALIVACAILLFVSIVQENGVVLRDRIGKMHIALRWSIYALGFIVVVVFGVYGQGYDASAFIYRNF